MAEGKGHILYYDFGYADSSLHRGNVKGEGIAFKNMRLVLSEFTWIHDGSNDQSDLN